MNDTRVNLDHIKPHRPLIRTQPSSVVNNISHIVHNNIRFSLTLQVKNRMAAAGFDPVTRMAAGALPAYYTEFPFDRYGLMMTDHQWYLHTSRLRDIYNKQQSFINIMQKRQAGRDTFLEILQRREHYEVSAPREFNPAGVTPSIYYITPKQDTASPHVSAAQPVKADTNVTNNETHQHKSEVVIENRPPDTHINVNRLVDKAVRAMEEKWDYERLRKGR